MSILLSGYVFSNNLDQKELIKYLDEKIDSYHLFQDITNDLLWLSITDNGSYDHPFIYPPASTYMEEDILILNSEIQHLLNLVIKKLIPDNTNLNNTKVTNALINFSYEFSKKFNTKIIAFVADDDLENFVSEFENGMIKYLCELRDNIDVIIEDKSIKIRGLELDEEEDEANMDVFSKNENIEICPKLMYEEVIELHRIPKSYFIQKKINFNVIGLGNDSFEWKESEGKFMGNGDNYLQLIKKKLTPTAQYKPQYATAKKGLL